MCAGPVYELRRVKRGIGEHSREMLEAVENDPIRHVSRLEYLLCAYFTEKKL